MHFTNTNINQNLEVHKYLLQLLLGYLWGRPGIKCVCFSFVNPTNCVSHDSPRRELKHMVPSLLARCEGNTKKLEMRQNAISTLKSLTNVHSVSGRPTLKDDHERTFRNESFQGLGEKSKQTWETRKADEWETAGSPGSRWNFKYVQTSFTILLF